MVIYIGRDKPQEHSGFLYKQISPPEHWSKHGKITKIKDECVRTSEKGPAWAKKKVKLPLL